jgi:XRE family aerobic/anaerobic benzoate catabolism transcriptional regulator
LIDQSGIARTIGTRVRATRHESGTTRRHLAERSDVSERYLNQLENGEANVSIAVLARVADALNVDMISLLSASGSPTLNGEHARLPAHAPLADIIGRMSLREQQDAVATMEQFLKDKRKSLKGIALLGLRGAGKTTIGNLFAKRHGLPFFSITIESEARAGISINDLFNLGGPEAYRTLENDVVKDLSGRNDRIVLETAGGIVSNGPALDLIIKSFKTVWLKASPEEHLERVVRQGDMRPIRGTPQALEHLKTLLATREQEYSRADCVLDTTGRTPEACVDELEKMAAAVIAS